MRKSVLALWRAERPVALNDLDDLLHELVRTQRLGNVRSEPHLFATLFDAVHRVRRQGDDWQGGQRRIAAQLVQHLPAVHVRHRQVGNHEVRLVRAGGFQTLAAILSGEDPRARQPEPAAGDLQAVRLVVHDQDGPALELILDELSKRPHEALSLSAPLLGSVPVPRGLCGSSSGTSTVKVLPCPTSLLTRTVPPIRLVRRLTIASPRPAPPNLRE